ncbi:CLAVATA3/ESR (CLE)-related protein 41-like [Melia azedarach]|uniref:CLAVATA3/ESR (CLE)-related protein 41-like n=1 Tax=Melia azedarach TaxID=155640 RepID=A0ACC1Z0Z2_MELAZ|nr:CLAVATA3/ESR (CLE)-related protein 41-like [Melia azedarach]
MDIEPFWALGGWFIVLLDCMAAAESDRLQPKSQSKLSQSSNTSKPFSFLLIFALIFALILLNTPSQLHPSSSVTTKRFLLQTADTYSPATSTMNLHHPKQAQNIPSSSSAKSRGREFEADNHEVPSGPNPISNR